MSGAVRPLGVWAKPARPTRTRAGRSTPFPLGEPGVRLHARARQAIALSLPTLGVRVGDEALVPAWHHGSEVEALLAAGLACRSYEIGPDLRPDPEELEGLLRPRTRVLHLVHYLGFPQDAASWREFCDRHGLLLVEDAAQAWLASVDGVPVGAHGDLAVFCLYKSLGLPDGAAAVSTTGYELPRPDLPAVSGLRWAAAQGVRALWPDRGPVPAPGPYDQHADVAVGALAREPSRVTSWLLERCSTVDVAPARRRAYSALLEGLPEHVAPGFSALAAGASPFVFPIAVREKAPALLALANCGVAALDVWSRPHPAVETQADGTAAWLRRHTIGLPVHQDLGAHDLRRLVSAAGRLTPAEPRISV